jgi:hypothetical protein
MGGLMALLANGDQTNPPRRGKFIAASILCTPPPPPTVGLVIEAPKIDPDTSARERWEAHRSNPQCANCHALFDPLGLAFENYSAIGRWQTTDGGRAVDAAGTLSVGSDVDGPFSGAYDLAQKLAQSRTAAGCFAEHVFAYAAGRRHADDDACTMGAIDQRGEASGYDVRQLLLGVIDAPGFLYHRPETEVQP